MPRSGLKPVLAITILSGAAIFVAFPDYVDLQSAPSPDEFLGVLGDATPRATAAAVMDLVFSLAYGMLGVLAFAWVASGVPRLIGTIAIVGAALADEVENAFVLLALRDGSDLKASTIDAMSTAGGIKWGLIVTAVVLFLALTGQRWLDERRS